MNMFKSLVTQPGNSLIIEW